MIVYKVQYRDAASTTFQDDGDWSTCEECIHRMRSLFDSDYRRDLRVIDDRGVVVASTIRTPSHPVRSSEKGERSAAESDARVR